MGEDTFAQDPRVQLGKVRKERACDHQSKGCEDCDTDYPLGCAFSNPVGDVTHQPGHGNRGDGSPKLKEQDPDEDVLMLF